MQLSPLRIFATFRFSDWTDQTQDNR